jgi:hypothetical protein
MLEAEEEMTTTTHAPSPRKPRLKPRPPVGVRRFGYFVAVLLNAGFLYVINIWPGWQAVPFLTSETRLVLDLVNASIVVNLLANVVYAVADPRWLKALGDAVTTAVGLVVMVRFWDVFPFDFGDTTIDWALVTRCVLALGIVGTAVGVVVNAVLFLRALVDPRS